MAAAIDIDDGATTFGEPIEPIRFDPRDLDPAASPRADLDAFVNARWRAANPVPPDRSCWDSFALLAERTLQIQARIAVDASRRTSSPGSATRIVGDFWTSGVREFDDEGIELVRSESARIDALDSPAAIAMYLCERHARGCGLLFRFDVEPDFEDPTRMTACVTQGGLGLPDRDAYFDATPRGFARRQAYQAHIAALLELSGQPAARAAIAAGDVVDFETELARASTPRRILARDIGARFRPIDIDAADRESRPFSWSAFFSTLRVAKPARFSLAMPTFHARVAELLHAMPLSVWRAYLRFHTLDDAAPYLGGAFARQHHRFHDAALRGRTAPLPRWKEVLRAIDANAGEAMGELYVAETFAPGAKRRIVELVECLRKAFASRLERVDWMSDETRAHALRKLAALGVKVGYPDRWRDWTGLVTSPHSLYANVLAARAFDLRWRAAQLAAPADRSLWPIAPQAVNAGYDPQRNEIIFPAAILAPPFFDPAADDAFNYGGIGAVIAHEMTHAFDDQGSRFDADGRFRNGWLDSDRRRFESLAERLVDRFDTFEVDGARVDGRLTLGENIADFGGLAIAFDALQDALAGRDDPMVDGYSQTQRFFFNWAVIWRQNLTPEEARLRLATDVHAPARIRANAAPAELPAYAEAFGCDTGDAMLRSADARLRIW